MNSDAPSSRWVREGLSLADASPADSERAVLAEVLRAIRRVRHGSVNLVLQDGRVVQIDILEKRRL